MMMEFEFMVTKHILNLIEVTITNALVTVNSNVTSSVTSLLISHDVPHVLAIYGHF
jgi:hypothetical protein